jgi:hypothetical protein
MLACPWLLVLVVLLCLSIELDGTDFHVIAFSASRRETSSLVFALLPLRNKGGRCGIHQGI